jgi:hypothetical protein
MAAAAAAGARRGRGVAAVGVPVDMPNGTQSCCLGWRGTTTVGPARWCPQSLSGRTGNRQSGSWLRCLQQVSQPEKWGQQRCLFVEGQHDREQEDPQPALPGNANEQPDPGTAAR